MSAAKVGDRVIVAAGPVSLGGFNVATLDTPAIGVVSFVDDGEDWTALHVRLTCGRAVWVLAEQVRPAPRS